MKLKFLIVLLSCAGLFFAAEAKILSSLSIKGLTYNQPSLVRNAITLHEGKDFSSTDVQESIRQLYNLGLFRTVDISVDSESNTSVALTIQLEEFPFCEGVEYSGLKKLKPKDVEEKVTVKRGQVATDASIFKSERAIYNVYAEKGYLLAEVKAQKIATKVPGNVIVKFNVKEGPKVRIKKITFKGNTNYKSSKLERKFKTKESRWWRSGDFNRDLYREHLDSLIMFYNDQGFIDASIVKDSVWYSESKKDINIDITIDEGKKYYTGDFAFTGNSVINSDSLKTKIALRKGKPFQKSRFDLSKYTIENAYREEGYLWIRVDDRKTYRGDTIDVTFDINEGNPAVVQKIDIKGNGKTMEKVVRREIELMPGQKYKQSLMARSQQKIYALNYFGNVTPDLSPNDDGTIDLVFNVAEKDNIGQLSIGAAYSEQDKFVGTFSTSIPNFRGAGQELKVNLEYGQNKKDVTLGFTEPWAFDMPLLLAGSIFYDNVLYIDNTLNESYGAQFTVGGSKLRWPDDHWTARATYTISHVWSSGIPITRGNLRLIESGLKSDISGVIQRYDFDMPTFPTTGSKLTITPEIAGLGGDFTYLKTIFAYEHYFSLPFKLVLGSKTNIGIIGGLFDTTKISTYDLFRLGGVWTGYGDLRGYDDNIFGAKNDGVAMLTSTIELRYPLIEQQMYIGAFFDIGNTYSSIESIDLSNIYKGIGIGARINIPMLGIMGMDIGYGLDPQPNEARYAEKPRGFKFDFLMNRGF